MKFYIIYSIDGHKELEDLKESYPSQNLMKKFDITEDGESELGIEDWDKHIKMTALLSKKEFEQLLNEISIPADDLKSNGGRIPDKALYGSWLRRNDPILFNIAYREEINRATYHR